MSEDSKKTAGATVYLVEELSDARMRCDQLIRYVGDATRLVENSPHREAIFESAGHLLYTIPQVLFRLQKALQAAALATNKLDSEEIKADLRPEKVQQLEGVLRDVRIRQIKRHSEPTMVDPNDSVWNVDTPLPSREAAAREYPEMNQLAQNIAKALDVIKRDGEKLIKEMKRTDMDGVATSIDVRGVENLVRVVSLARGDMFGWGGFSFAKMAAEGSFLMPRMIDAIERQLKELKHSYELYKRDPEKNKPQLDNFEAATLVIYKAARMTLRSVFKTKLASDELDQRIARLSDPVTKSLVNAFLMGAEEPTGDMSDVRNAVRTLSQVAETTAKSVPWTPVMAAAPLGPLSKLAEKAWDLAWTMGSVSPAAKQASDEEEDKQSRFEEGKPADPTKNMSPEDKAKWHANKEKHKDKFKAAKADPWEADDAR